MVTQFAVMTGQTVMVLLFAFITVVDVNGGLGWVVLLTVLTGLCGMCFGKSNGFYLYFGVFPEKTDTTVFSIQQKNKFCNLSLLCSFQALWCLVLSTMREMPHTWLWVASCQL